MSDSILDTIEAVERETDTILAPPGVMVNSSFSRINPKLQIAHDSTSIKAGTKCWRNYYYSIVQGYTASGPGVNPHLFFGTLFHAATELYTKLRIGNWDWRLYRQLRRTGIPKADLVRDRAGTDHDRAMVIVLRWIFYYSFDHKLKRPWISDEPTKTLKTLLRTTVWYLDHFKDENLETLTLNSGKPAVELSFRFNLDDLTDDGSFLAPTGESYMLCGHIDRVVSFNEEIWILDKKTTRYALDERYFQQFSPDIQITLYSIAANIIFGDNVGGMIIDAAQILVNGTRFRRKPIPREPEHLEEWLRGLKRYLHELETCVKFDDWPMREESCGYGYMQCQFRPVCTAAPSVREQMLEAFYTKRHWDPLIPR